MGVFTQNTGCITALDGLDGPIANEYHSDTTDDLSQGIYEVIRTNPNLKGRVKLNCSVRRIKTVGGSKGERGPDISLWSVDPQTGKRDKPLLIIEIIRYSKGSKSYSTGSIMDCMKTQPTIKEAFMYDYIDNIWYKYQNGKMVICDSYSNFLQCYLNQLF